TFQFILLTDQSLVLTKLRNDIQFYKLKTPWILIGISLHVVTGFALKWYETRKRRRENTSTNEEYLQTIPFENSQREDTMNYCTKFWQFFLRILFSDSQQRSPSVVLDYTNDEITNILDYFSHTYTYGSLWLNYSSIPSYGISNNVNNISYLKHLPVWRFGMTRRGVCETFSDIEPENNRQFDDDNDEQRQSSVMSRICNYFNHKRKERKQCRRRKLSTISPMDLRNCYTSESDDNNNTIISRIYQCSICLEKYKYGDYLCSQKLAILFAQRGAIVILCDINEEGNKQTVQLINDAGLPLDRVYSYECDIGKREEVCNLVKRIQTDVGEVTMIVNNAAVLSSKAFLETSEVEFMRALDVNLFSSYWLIREILPSMLTKNHGHIIQILGTTALFGYGHFSDICTSKFAVTGLMESLDHELSLGGYDGIYTTLSCPHYISTQLYQQAKTRLNPLLPPLTLEYAAKKIVHGILVNKKFVCVPRFYYLIPLIKGILPSKAFLVLLNTFINPKIPVFVRQSSPPMTTTVPTTTNRKRNHFSSCE
ncbi:unnamed protein product, partial [Didymodactylos carnosus]